MAVAVKFLDLQLEMGDQRPVVGLLSAGGRSLRASNDQCRFQRFDVVWQRFKVRIPTKPAMHSNSKPAGYSDLKPATRGVVRMGQFHDVVEGWEGQETG
ncbi:hypothetical protein [Bradyrhizobium cytisi]|uniref:hypothetical protein n=1 Tax=Bradyrhizobium cytisi TaxID=515489 RepID=UPI001FE295AB|nr:hypothetical protein [Bradyrhizobium cytisi]